MPGEHYRAQRQAETCDSEASRSGAKSSVLATDEANSAIKEKRQM